MAKIRITESELKQVIRESVESILNESVNEKYLQVDLQNMPRPVSANTYYDNLMANPSPINGANLIKANNRDDLYSQLERLGFSKEEIVRGLNTSGPQVFRTRMDGTAKNITNTNRGQRKIDRARRYSGKHGGPEASEVTTNQIQDLQNQLSSATTTINDLQSQLSAATENATKWENAYNSLRTKNAELTKANQNLNQQIAAANQARIQNTAASALNRQTTTAQVNAKTPGANNSASALNTNPQRTTATGAARA